MDAASTKTMRAEQPRLIGLQYLRAIAALEVVLAHSLLAARLQAPVPPFGVPLFFVMSGFLMVAITDDRSRPWPFIKDRLVRIVPLYWIATTAAVLVLLARDAPDPVRALASYLFIPVGPPGFGQRFYPVLNVGWTLNYEMVFYAVFASLLTLPRRLLLPALSFVFLAAAASSFYVGTDAAPLGFWCNPLILQFLAGAWLGHFWSKGRSMGLPLLGCVICFFLLPLAAGHLRNALWLGLPCTLLLVATLELERSGAFARAAAPPRRCKLFDLPLAHLRDHGRRRSRAAAGRARLVDRPDRHDRRRCAGRAELCIPGSSAAARPATQALSARHRSAGRSVSARFDRCDACIQTICRGGVSPNTIS